MKIIKIAKMEDEMESKNKIESSVMRLINPGQFETSVVDRQLHHGEVVVSPEVVSVCHADLRYFSGDRRKEALRQKLPMALFHEGVGRVVESKSDLVAIGTRVSIIPNIASFHLNGISKEDCCTACR